MSRIISPISMALAVGDGTVNVDGSLRVQPLGFDGRVRASQVPLPDVVTTVGAVTAFLPLIIAYLVTWAIAQPEPEPKVRVETGPPPPAEPAGTAEPVGTV